MAYSQYRCGKYRNELDTAFHLSVPSATKPQWAENMFLFQRHHYIFLTPLTQWHEYRKPCPKISHSKRLLSSFKCASHITKCLMLPCASRHMKQANLSHCGVCFFSLFLFFIRRIKCLSSHICRLMWKHFEVQRGKNYKTTKLVSRKKVGGFESGPAG